MRIFPKLGCLIVGGGPAGLAPLVAASREGSLSRILAQRIAVVEQTTSIGAGNLGSYAIWSDSTAESFLTAVKDHRDARLGTVYSSYFCSRLQAEGFGPISLTDAACLQQFVGRVLHQAIVDEEGDVFVEHEALHARKTTQGWLTCVRSTRTGKTFDLESRSLVLGTGGYQSASRLETEHVAGAPLLPRFKSKIILSDDVLRHGGVKLIEPFLAEGAKAKVVIVGGSTSAVAVADLLIRALPERWAPGAISIMHRRPLRVFFRSVEEARQTSYFDFDLDDVCPITGFVYRLAGLRQHSRDLLMRILGVGDPRSEYRIDLRRIDQSDLAGPQQLLEEADVIIAALGYRPKALNLFDESGRNLPLPAKEHGGQLVDGYCRVLGTDGIPLPGLYAIGLATGFKLTGALGGEASFEGQANGLWLWQNDVGLLIAHAILEAGRLNRSLAQDEVERPSMKRRSDDCFSLGVRTSKR